MRQAQLSRHMPCAPFESFMPGDISRIVPDPSMAVPSICPTCAAADRHKVLPHSGAPKRTPTELHSGFIIALLHRVLAISETWHLLVAKTCLAVRKCGLRLDHVLAKAICVHIFIFLAISGPALCQSLTFSTASFGH